MDYPVISATIRGVTARGVLMLMRAPIPIGVELMSVKDAEDVDRAMSDPENLHCCPLCNDFFKTFAFRAHAQECIDARAPRTRVWLPPGTKGVIHAYKEKIKPDFADPDSDLVRQAIADGKNWRNPGG